MFFKGGMIMWLWWFMLGCNLLIPAIMLGAGWMMYKHCPKDINWVYGYRTARSMKNMDTWAFAHEHCGKLWHKAGLWMLLPSVLAMIPFWNGTEEIIGMVGLIVMTLQLAVLIGSIFPTEKALKNTFNEDGTRK